MKLLLILFPVSLATISPHRNTVFSRIERMTELIADTRVELVRRSQELSRRRGLYQSMFCEQMISVLPEDMRAFISYQQVIKDLSDAAFPSRWHSYTPGMKQEFCLAFFRFIQTSERKILRQEASVRKLTQLLDMYRSMLLTMDRQESVDVRYEGLLLMGSQFEFYERGIVGIPRVLHEVVLLENKGNIFWDPRETPHVLHDLITEIMVDGEDVQKLRICFERILGSRTMNAYNLQALVKQLLAPYKVVFRQLGDDILNTETALLEEYHRT